MIAAERDQLLKINAELLAVLKSARLMLYAWRGIHEKQRWGPHPELHDFIAEVETVIAKAEGKEKDK